jgi:hypothetical protein
LRREEREGEGINRGDDRDRQLEGDIYINRYTEIKEDRSIYKSEPHWMESMNE